MIVCIYMSICVRVEVCDHMQGFVVTCKARIDLGHGVGDTTPTFLYFNQDWTVSLELQATDWFSENALSPSLFFPASLSLSPSFSLFLSLSISSLSLSLSFSPLSLSLITLSNFLPSFQSHFISLHLSLPFSPSLCLPVSLSLSFSRSLSILVRSLAD